MGKQYLKKIVWLYDILKNESGLTFNEINEAWTVSSANIDGSPFSKRSFFEYRNAIEEVFNVNVVCEKGIEYRYRIESDSSDDVLDKMKSTLLK